MPSPREIESEETWSGRFALNGYGVVRPAHAFQGSRNSLYGFQSIGRDAKHCLYILRFADTYLNMCLFEEAGRFIDAFALKKYAADGFKGFPTVALCNRVNVIDYGAVQMALQQVGAAPVLRHLATGLLHVFFEVGVGVLNEFDPRGRD
jgi:hypothetical protein